MARLATSSSRRPATPRPASTPGALAPGAATSAPGVTGVRERRKGGPWRHYDRPSPRLAIKHRYSDRLLAEGDGPLGHQLVAAAGHPPARQHAGGFGAGRGDQRARGDGRARETEGRAMAAL